MADRCSSNGSSREPIFATDRGAIHRCSCCGALHVRLGSALLTIPPTALDALQQALVALDGDPVERWLGGRRQLHIGESGVSIVLTPDDIADALRLVAGAELFLSLNAA